MPSYIYLTLDTTAPKLQIHAPSYSIREEPDEIVVEANEELSSFQDIYAIDSEGKRHGFTLSLSEDKKTYTGLVSFNEFSYGPATLYARVADKVGNISEVHTASLTIITALIGNQLKLETSIRTRVVHIKDASRGMRDSIHERYMPTRELSPIMDVDTKIREIHIKTE